MKIRLPMKNKWIVLNDFFSKWSLRKNMIED
jgi:hypothetical protein